MGPAYCHWRWQMTITAILIASFQSFFIITSVKGVSTLRSDAHNNFPEILQCTDQLLGQTPESFSYATDEHATFKHNSRSLVVSASGSSPRREVQALIAFKDSVTADPLGALKSWSANDSDACGWTGIKCSPSSHNVVDISLSSLELAATMPVMIGQLAFLESLDLSNNFLKGSIPDSISNCSNLLYLNISLNLVTGEIPSEVGELFNLKIFDAEMNNLTGVIPDAIANCSLVEYLSFGSNSLTGAIPSVLGKLSSLTRLYLYENSLAGTIPSTLGNCSSLASLNLGVNPDLGGELPQELSQWKSMGYLALSQCNFHGAFPIWITNFTSLSVFDMRINSVSGEIPEEIGKLSENLTILTLRSNQISGPIPSGIANCTALTALDLSFNKLTGHILSGIGLLGKMELLVLLENVFSGVIPSSLSNCSALRWLELSSLTAQNRQVMPSWIGSLVNLEIVALRHMNLYGTIPSSVGHLSRLQWLSVQENYLSGVVPNFLGNLSSLQLLDLTKNELEGEVPSTITGNLSHLSVLTLGLNSFRGSIPKIASLSMLELFDINYNLFSGKLDSDIGVRGSQLDTFTAGHNNLSGSIPESLANFSKLSYLSLHSNSFTGSIPAFLGNLTKLTTANLHLNKLEGGIPTSLMNCFQLSALFLSINKLEGSIPREFGQLVNLQSLYLFANFLSGPLPLSLGNLSRMQDLDLSSNGFSESIPGEILSKMAFSLFSLNLSHNLFSGSWPLEIKLLANLEDLDLSTNNISGTIPLGLVECTGLTIVDVSLNNFTGLIPQDLGLLRHLQFFNGSFNNFEGPIPDRGLFQTRNISRDSFLGNPGLCGSTALVSQPCARSTPSQHSCNGFTCRRVWLSLVIAISILLLLGTLITCWLVFDNNKKQEHQMVGGYNLQGSIVLQEEEVMAIIQGGNENIIGMGAKSIVYKGVRPGGEMFALKVLRNEDTDDHRGQVKSATDELLREVHTLAQLKHSNIIKILGLSIIADVKALILEYMPRGSLHDLLYRDPNTCHLSYEDRFTIILGIAKALVYLHDFFHDPIIHRDLKPSNILLGTELEPKLSDFGISKFAKYSSVGGELETTASTICGTFGYIPPEYATQSRVSARGDVYSYGVVLLELLTRRNPTRGSFGPSGDLVGFVLESFQERPFEILDSSLMEEWRTNTSVRDQLMLLLRIGLLCTRRAPKSRPEMKDVLEMLEQVKDIGAEVAPLRSVEELANDITVWEPAVDTPDDEIVSASSS